MGNRLKKRKLKLKARQDEYDAMPMSPRKAAMKRPGSLNAHKQGSLPGRKKHR